MKHAFQQFIERLFQKNARLHANNLPSLLEFVDRSKLAQPEHLIRLGTAYGGWIIPREPALTESSICYLAGAGEDISFDCALAKLFCCCVRIVDPTPRAIKHFKELEQSIKEDSQFPINGSNIDFYDITASAFARLSFLPFGLADKDDEQMFYMPKNPAHVSCSIVNLQKTDKYFTALCYRLTTLMTLQGDVKIDLLKMDIEGGEYVVIKDLVASNTLPRILLIEFDEAHTPLDQDAGKRIKEHINELVSVGMRCIAVEGSNATFIKPW